MGVFTQSGSALEWRGGHEIVRIEPWGANSLRVRGTVWQSDPGRPARRAAHAPPAAGAVEPAPGCDPGRHRGRHARITHGDITAEVSASGQLAYFGADGRELLSEMTPHFTGPPMRRYRANGGGTHHFEVLFNAHDDERFYGLGQHQHGRLNQKGAVVELIQRNTEVSIPFLVSSRGYGLLWNHPGVGRVELGTTATRWVSEATRQWDYWITAGAEPAQIIRQYGDVAGRAPMMPEWATGFWQCKLRYKTQDELLGVAREYKERGLPLSVIVIDYFHWSLQGDWKFEPSRVARPGRHGQGTGPARGQADGVGLAQRQPGQRELRRDEPTAACWSRASTAWTSSSRSGTATIRASGSRWRFYDSTNPEARDFIWSRVKRNYYDYGIRTWWLDACEPELVPEAPENLRYHLGPGLETTNIYPMLHARGFYEHMQAEGEDEILSLCRSAWAGSQRWGALVWSGDIDSTFEDLRRQITAGLSIGLSGIPWWTTDIGGFKNGNINRPVVPRADRPLVPVRRVLPGVPAARVPPPGHRGRLGAHRRGQRGVELRRPSSTRSSAA